MCCWMRGFRSRHSAHSAGSRIRAVAASTQWRVQLGDDALCSLRASISFAQRPRWRLRPAAAAARGRRNESGGGCHKNDGDAAGSLRAPSRLEPGDPFGKYKRRWGRASRSANRPGTGRIKKGPRPLKLPTSKAARCCTLKIAATCTQQEPAPDPELPSLPLPHRTYFAFRGPASTRTHTLCCQQQLPRPPIPR